MSFITFYLFRFEMFGIVNDKKPLEIRRIVGIKNVYSQ